ncbi:hypothetical protein KKA09_02390 [Patescibacteria group bacterium]|nr:hypothetical protein [Patescibacteria group bacterium]
MPLKVKKQLKENSQSLIFRFTKKIKATGILMEVKRRMFKKREKSRPLKKRAALKKEEKRKEYEKLKKFRKV